MAAIDDFNKALENELSTNWSHLSGDALHFVKATASELAGRFIAAHPNGPLPRASNVVAEAVKRYHQAY
jgi:hypothetical protein